VVTETQEEKEKRKKRRQWWIKEKIPAGEDRAASGNCLSVIIKKFSAASKRDSNCTLANKLAFLTVNFRERGGYTAAIPAGKILDEI